MSDFAKLLDIFLNVIKINTVEGVFYTGLLVMCVWLFKEFKKNKIEIDNFDKQRINDALLVYGKAINSIKKYELNKTDEAQFLDDLALIYPYATREVAEAIDKIIMDINNVNYVEIHTTLHKEILRLKSLQYDSVAFKFNNRYLDLIGYYYKKNNFSIFIEPIIATFISIMGIFSMILFMATYDNVNTVSRIVLIMLIVAFTFQLFLSMATIDLIWNKEFNGTKTNWVLTIILWCSPLIFAIHSKWIVGIVYIAYIAIYMIFIFKKLVKRNIIDMNNKSTDEDK